MSGPAKVAAITLLCVVALFGLNLAMWRRARKAVAEGRRRERATTGDALGQDDPRPTS